MTELYDRDNEEIMYDGIAILLAGVVDYLIDNASENIPAKHFVKDFSTKSVTVNYNQDSDCFEFSIEDAENSVLNDGDNGHVPPLGPLPDLVQEFPY